MPSRVALSIFVTPAQRWAIRRAAAEREQTMQEWLVEAISAALAEQSREQEAARV